MANVRPAHAPAALNIASEHHAKRNRAAPSGQNITFGEKSNPITLPRKHGGNHKYHYRPKLSTIESGVRIESPALEIGSLASEPAPATHPIIPKIKAKHSHPFPPQVPLKRFRNGNLSPVPIIDAKPWRPLRKKALVRSWRKKAVNLLKTLGMSTVGEPIGKPAGRAVKRSEKKHRHRCKCRECGKRREGGNTDTWGYGNYHGRKPERAMRREDYDGTDYTFLPGKKSSKGGKGVYQRAS